MMSTSGVQLDGGGPPDKFQEIVDVTIMTGAQQFELVNAKVDEKGYNTFLFINAHDGNFIMFGYYKK